MDRTGQGFVALRRRGENIGRGGETCTGYPVLTGPDRPGGQQRLPKYGASTVVGVGHWARLLCRLGAVVDKIPGQRTTDEEAARRIDSQVDLGRAKAG